MALTRVLLTNHNVLGLKQAFFGKLQAAAIITTKQCTFEEGFTDCFLLCE